MGQISWIKSVIAGTLLLITCGVLYYVSTKEYQIDYSVSLADSRLGENGWVPVRDLPMTDNVVEALALDDYLFRQFRSPQGDLVSLYIGFYYSSDKVGAAHDPLVCFQGQGWQVSDRRQDQLQVPNDAAHEQINYSNMLATNQDHQEYVFFWFQAFDSSTATTLQQKLKTFANKLAGKGTANAFVRVTTTVRDSDVAAAKNRAQTFAQDFYPSFYHYVVHD